MLRPPEHERERNEHVHAAHGCEEVPVQQKVRRDAPKDGGGSHVDERQRVERREREGGHEYECDV